MREKVYYIANNTPAHEIDAQLLLGTCAAN